MVTPVNTCDSSGAIRMQRGRLSPHELHITLGGQGKGLGLQSSAELGTKDSMKLERSTQEQLRWIPRMKMASQKYVRTRQLKPSGTPRWGPEDWRIENSKIPWCKDTQARGAPGSKQHGAIWESLVGHWASLAWRRDGSCEWSHYLLEDREWRCDVLISRGSTDIDW